MDNAEKIKFEVQVHFDLWHGQCIFSHSLHTFRVFRRVARRLCRSGSLHDETQMKKTCTNRNRSSDHQASPTHSSVLPIRASPSACLAQRHTDRGAQVETITFPPPRLLSVFHHLPEYGAPGATWHDDGEWRRKKLPLPEGTTFFSLLYQFRFFFRTILHNSYQFPGGFAPLWSEINVTLDPHANWNSGLLQVQAALVKVQECLIIILDVVPPISMHSPRYDDRACVDKKCAFGLNRNSLAVWNIFSIPQLALVTTACLSRSSKDRHIKQKKKNTKRNQRKLQSRFIAHGKYCTNSLAEDWRLWSLTSPTELNCPLRELALRQTHLTWAIWYTLT